MTTKIKSPWWMMALQDKLRRSDNKVTIEHLESGRTKIRIDRMQMVITVNPEHTQGEVEVKGRTRFRLDFPQREETRVSLLYMAVLRVEMLAKDYDSTRARNNAMIMAGLGDHWGPEGCTPPPHALGVYRVE